MTTSHATLPLDRASRELLERIRKEIKRVETTAASGSTESVGGWTKLGASLQAFLRVVALWVCAAQGLVAEDELARSCHAQKRVDRITAGEWLRLLRDLGDTRAARAVEAALITGDAQARGSVLQRVLKFRNDAAHEAREPPPREALQVLRELSALIARYRAACGWPG